MRSCANRGRTGLSRWLASLVRCFLSLEEVNSQSQTLISPFFFLMRAGENLHMADGAAQKARDEALKRAAAGGKSPDRWGDKETQRRLYGLDVVKQADQEYARL